MKVSASLNAANETWKIVGAGERLLERNKLLYSIFHIFRFRIQVEDKLKNKFTYEFQYGNTPTQRGRIFVLQYPAPDKGGYIGVIETTGEFVWTPKCKCKKSDRIHKVFKHWYEQSINPARNFTVKELL
jgi:hypothetical protein